MILKLQIWLPLLMSRLSKVDFKVLDFSKVSKS